MLENWKSRWEKGRQLRTWLSRGELCYSRASGTWKGGVSTFQELGCPSGAGTLKSLATGAPLGAESTMQAAWWDLDYRENADIASDTPEVESEGWIWDNLAPPLFLCRFPPITEEKWPMVKSKWKPVGQRTREILLAGASPPTIPLYPIIKKKVGEGQGINLKINRSP